MHQSAPVGLHTLKEQISMYINTCQQVYLKADRTYHSIKTKTTEASLIEDGKHLSMEGRDLLLSLPGSGFNSWLGD